MSNNGGLNGNAGSVMTNERSLHENAEKVFPLQANIFFPLPLFPNWRYNME